MCCLQSVSSLLEGQVANELKNKSLLLTAACQDVCAQYSGSGKSEFVNLQPKFWINEEKFIFDQSLRWERAHEWAKPVRGQVAYEAALW